MIAVDTNILVYAHREDLPWHDAAAARLTELAEGASDWAIPWPCVHELLSTVTHPKIFKRPSSLTTALSYLEELRRAPGLRLLPETDAYWPILERQLRAGRVIGPMVHDARIAALCLCHGVSELWTADRDFGRFPALKTRNPLLA